MATLARPAVPTLSLVLLVAAAIGLVQLKKLEGWVKQRRTNALALTKGLEGIEGLVPPAEGNWMVHSYYQYIVRREDPFPLSRDDIASEPQSPSEIAKAIDLAVRDLPAPQRAAPPCA